MNILVITTSFPRTLDDYVGSFVATQVRSLSQRGHQITVVCPAASGIPTYEKWGAISINRVGKISGPRLAYGAGILTNIRQHPWRIIFIIPFLYAYYQAIQKYARQSDIIHVHWLYNALPLRFLRGSMRRPVVVTAHGSDVHLLKYWWWRVIIHCATRSVDYTITVSDFLRHQLASKNIIKSSIAVIPNSIEPHDRLTAVAAHQGNPYHLLWVGRLTQNKDPMLFIQLLRQLRHTGLPVQGTIVGMGPLATMVEAALQDAELQSYLQWQPAVTRSAMIRLYEQTGIVVSTAHQEGFGMVVAEAMLAGRVPVVLTNGGSDTFIESGVSGLLVDHPDKLLNTVRAVILDDKLFSTISRSAHNAVVTWGHPNSIAQQIEGIYTRLYKQTSSNTSLVQ